METHSSMEEVSHLVSPGLYTADICLKAKNEELEVKIENGEDKIVDSISPIMLDTLSIPQELVDNDIFTFISIDSREECMLKDDLLCVDDVVVTLPLELPSPMLDVEYIDFVGVDRLLESPFPWYIDIINTLIVNVIHDGEIVDWMLFMHSKDLLYSNTYSYGLDTFNYLEGEWCGLHLDMIPFSISM